MAHYNTHAFTPTRSQKHQAARRHASNGVRVFPCKGKSPHYIKGVLEHGCKDATTDQSRVNAFWNRFPEAQIGGAAGQRSGFFVLDVDSMEALAKLERRYGELPETFAVKTPRGGLHLYFRYVEGVTNSPGGLPDGIDVRGEGGYVLLPGSDDYVIVNRVRVADAPEWLLELVKERPHLCGAAGATPKRGRAQRWTGGTIKVGTRNRTLFFRGLHDKDRGWSYEEVLGDLLTVNAEWCEEPLDEAEVQKIAKSVMRYPVRSGDPSPEVLEAVERLEEFWWAHPWRGVGGKTDRDVYRVLIELARLYGSILEDGSVVVSASVRSVALAAATTFVTVSGGATKRLARAGLIRKTDSGRGRAEAATWVLLPPSAQTFNTQHFASTEAEMPCVKDLRAKRLWDLETPPVRWTGHLKKGRAGVINVLEAHGPLTETQTAALLRCRVRDLRRRYLESVEREDGSHVPGLFELGVVEERDGLLVLVEGHAERVEEIRRAPYTTIRRRRRGSRDGKRVVRWVEELEYTASEVEREEKDRKAHEEHREGFRLYLARRSPEADERCRELLNAWDEERESAGGTIEYDGAVVDAETGEVLEDTIIRSEREVFELARAWIAAQEAA